MADNDNNNEAPALKTPQEIGLKPATKAGGVRINQTTAPVVAEPVPDPLDVEVTNEDRAIARADNEAFENTVAAVEAVADQEVHHAPTRAKAPAHNGGHVRAAGHLNQPGGRQ